MVRNKVSRSQVVIYHDETKSVSGRNFKGHILFFVPKSLISLSHTPLFGTDKIEYSSQQMLFREVNLACKKYSCDGKLHFNQISGKRWSKYDYAYYESVALSIDALRHKFQKRFSYPLQCKVAVLFYPKGADWSIYGGHDRKEEKLRHDETVLRILLKGASHYLYDDNNQIEIENFYTDGYSAHRTMSEERILWKLTYDEVFGRVPLRNYVSFNPNASLIHLPSNHRKYSPKTDEYIHARLLQVTDLLLGSVMRSCYVGIATKTRLPQIGDTCKKRDIISQPVRDMLKKKERGLGFQYSGHHKSFTVNQVEFNPDGISFREVQPFDIKIQDVDSLQLKFDIGEVDS